MIDMNEKLNGMESVDSQIKILGALAEVLAAVILKDRDASRITDILQPTKDIPR
jgi:hypothetical protein